MAQTTATSPSTIVDDATVGTVAWTNPDNAKVSDDVWATASIFEGEDILDSSVKIVKADGTIGTTNKASGTSWSATEAYFSYGSSSDLWGETWTAENINDVDFGIVLSVIDQGVISHYLKATNFGFSIPTGATINGILAEIERKKIIGGNATASVDHIRITVYYTEGVSSISSSISASISSSPSISISASISSSPSISISASISTSPSTSISSSLSSSPSPSTISGKILGRNNDTGIIMGVRYGIILGRNNDTGVIVGTRLRKR